MQHYWFKYKVVMKTYPILVIPGYVIMLWYTSISFWYISHVVKLYEFKINQSLNKELGFKASPTQCHYCYLCCYLYLVTSTFNVIYCDIIIYCSYNVCMIIIFLNMSKIINYKIRIRLFFCNCLLKTQLWVVSKVTSAH